LLPVVQEKENTSLVVVHVKHVPKERVGTTQLVFAPLPKLLLIMLVKLAHPIKQLMMTKLLANAQLDMDLPFLMMTS